MSNGKPSTFDTAGDDSRFVDKHLENIKSNMIVTTEDKLEINLLKHLNKVEIKQAWLAPFSLFASVIATLITATFIDRGFSAAVWKAFFVIVAVSSFSWLLKVLFSAYMNRGKSTVEYLIGKITNKSEFKGTK